MRHVMNITDVDDKIIRNAAAAGIPISQYSAVYERAFFEDLEALAGATARDDGAGYRSHFAHGGVGAETGGGRGGLSDGRGKLVLPFGSFSGVREIKQERFIGMEDGARVDVDEYEKDSARDFALWKSAKPGETAGIRRLGAGGRAGTSSARRWRWSIWGRASTCTPAARI